MPDPAPTEPHPPAGELDARKAAILNAVVSEYIETAQPVGSGHIAGAEGVEVSSATVRSEMAALERDGYLDQPHTSAGRVPTDKGYRFFVDHLTRPGALGTAERQEVRRFFADVHGEMEELLGRTSTLLAQLTDCAAVVVGPSHDAAPIRSAQLVGLAPRVALLVVVLADGAVEKRTVELAAETTDEVLAAASLRLQAGLHGATLTALPAPPPAAPDDPVAAVVDRGWAALGSLAPADDAEQVFVGGSSRMAAAFDAVDTVRQVLSILEQQLVVVSLIEDVLDRGLSVAIGAEHGFEPLASCALVVSAVSVEGEPAGTIGVLGPTRMHYPRAMAAVQVVGEQLSRRLTRGPGDDEPPRRGRRPGGA